jgi:hypothetical protein
MWITLMIVVYLPSHYLFKRFFGSEDQIKNR